MPRRSWIAWWSARNRSCAVRFPLGAAVRRLRSLRTAGTLPARRPRQLARQPARPPRCTGCTHLPVSRRFRTFRHRCRSWHDGRLRQAGSRQPVAVPQILHFPIFLHVPQFSQLRKHRQSQYFRPILQIRTSQYQLTLQYQLPIPYQPSCACHRRKGRSCAATCQVRNSALPHHLQYA